MESFHGSLMDIIPFPGLIPRVPRLATQILKLYRQGEREREGEGKGGGGGG